MTETISAGLNPVPRKRATSFWVAIILVVLLAFSVIGNIVLLFGLMGSLVTTSFDNTVQKTRYDEQFLSGDSDASDKILCIPVSGIILRERNSGFFGGINREDMVDAIINNLKRAREDESVKALVLRINSPGGGITECDQIHKEIIRFKQQRPEVPIISVMEDLAASGGYYISAPATRIVAAPTTLTGSIGVIMDLMNIEGLYDKLGLKDVVFKSGDKKDMGSATRSMSDEEKAIFQSLINELYQRFVEVVDEGRGTLNKEQVLKLADGRVYTGNQALQNGLVDELGDFDDGIAAAKKLANLTKARVIEYKRRWNLFSLFEAAAQNLNPQARLLDQVNTMALGRITPKFLYLWAVK
jgi:protease IV